jgi:predicted nucleotide-binding protein (sugar kinase/HSP70/actin superfamily)
MIIGIPRALLYYVYEDLWLGFFQNLGIDTVVSPVSNKEIVSKGVSNSIDEACFSSKVFIGHVEYLLDKCDMVFVPRIENAGIREEYCTRIFGLYDLVKNTFPSVQILNADINYLMRKKESDAFVQLGQTLGKNKDESLSAYKKALVAADEARAKRIAAQEELLSRDGRKVLLFSHAYNSFDAAIGRVVSDFFAENGILIAYADLIETREAKSLIKDIYGSRIYWKLTAELLGGVQKYKDQVDGIVIISTFPCGPDSIFNELLIRIVKDKPILSLIFDETDTTAGTQTRLESFVDIITAGRKEGS